MSDDLPNSRLHAKQIEFTIATALAGGKHAGKFLQTVKSIRELAENQMVVVLSEMLAVPSTSG